MKRPLNAIIGTIAAIVIVTGGIYLALQALPLSTLGAPGGGARGGRPTGDAAQRTAPPRGFPTEGERGSRPTTGAPGGKGPEGRGHSGGAEPLLGLTQVLRSLAMIVVIGGVTALARWATSRARASVRPT